MAAAPAVSPDGTQIAFVVRGEGRGRLHLMASDGTGVHRVAEALDIRGAPSWAPDAKWIVAVASEGETTPLFKIPVDGGAPVRIAEGIISNPVWSPAGRFILYSENLGVAALVQIRGVTPDGQPFPLPKMTCGFTGDRYRFMSDGKNLVLMQGVLWRQNFWLINLETGRRRQLTDLRSEFETRSFDISRDGKQILMDRVRQNSDVVLIDLPPR